MVQIEKWLIVSLVGAIILVLLLLASRPRNTKKKPVNEFVRLMVSNGDEVSSKRVIALIAFILMAVSYTYGIVTDTKIPEYMWEGFLFIVLAAFFSGSIEKFKRNGNY